MGLGFTKMHGLGNDFVVFDALQAPLTLAPEQCRHLADRRRGVGCDQILVIETGREGADFDYRIYNADGSQAEQCGNGVRCVARWLERHGKLKGRRARLRSTAGISVEVELQADDRVSVAMGEPRLVPAEIPLQADGQAVTYRLLAGERELEIGAVSMGNPHAILAVDSVAAAPVAELGPLLERHPRFPARTNVEFLQIDSPDLARLRVWERGVGETQACGSGACAAMVWGRLAGRLAETAEIRLPGGPLVISWHGPGKPVWMTGPAEFVFEGQLP